MSLGVCNIDPDRLDLGTASGEAEGSLPASPSSLTPLPALGTFGEFLTQPPKPSACLGAPRLDSPDLHSIFHHCHVCLTLCWWVDGQFSRWNHKAFAERQPHALPKRVGESAGTPNATWLGLGINTTGGPGALTPAASFSTLVVLSKKESIFPFYGWDNWVWWRQRGRHLLTHPDHWRAQHVIHSPAAKSVSSSNHKTSSSSFLQIWSWASLILSQI